MDASKKIEHFPCPGCSADMHFDPETGGMKCAFCGHTEALGPSTVEIHAHPIEEAMAQIDSKLMTPLSAQTFEVSCESCGSAVLFEPPEVAGACPFCGMAIVAQPKAADPLIAPDAVLPVKVAKAAAQAEVRAWLSSRWFAPGALQRMAQSEGIGGVYLPFWTYASETASRYEGQRGEHYWVTENYTEIDSNGNSVQRSREVRHTRWHSASGQVARNFDNVLIPATKAMNEARLNALEPWDLQALRPYEPAYLAGFKAQRYQVQVPEGFEEAKEVRPFNRT